MNTSCQQQLGQEGEEGTPTGQSQAASGVMEMSWSPVEVMVAWHHKGY